MRGLASEDVDSPAAKLIRVKEESDTSMTYCVGPQVSQGNKLSESKGETAISLNYEKFGMKSSPKFSSLEMKNRIECTIFKVQSSFVKLQGRWAIPQLINCPSGSKDLRGKST